MILGKADIHVHSSYSIDSSTSVEVLLDQAANRAMLDVVAITDHDSIRGSMRAQELAADYGIGVIPGCEISTKQGHLLALFISKLVPKGLSLAETLYRVGSQGGLCVAAHPMAPHVPALKAGHIHAVLAEPDLRRVLVGIETVNTGLPYDFSNRLAARLCRDTGLSATGSSDAHASWAIGDGVTIFPGNTPEAFRQALVEGTTMAVSQLQKKTLSYWSSNLYHMGRRLLGWTMWASEPGASYEWRRVAKVRTAAG